MKMQHTPGPWKVVTPPDLSGDPHELSIKAGIVPIARISRAATINLPEREANARLIAAAPDLLAALECCESWFVKFSPTAELVNDLGRTEHPMLTMIRAAIAKAVQS